MFPSHRPNPDPELTARHSRPQSFRARFEGTLIAIGVIVVLMVVLSIVFRIL